MKNSHTFVDFINVVITGVVIALAIIVVNCLPNTARSELGKLGNGGILSWMDSESSTPIHHYEVEPIMLVDTDGMAHKVEGDGFPFHHAQLFQDVEGHELTMVVSNCGAVVIHITPCKRCCELNFDKTHKLEPSQIPNR